MLGYKVTPVLILQCFFFLKKIVYLDYYGVEKKFTETVKET